MNTRERIKRILEDAGMDYVSNSTIDDIMEEANKRSYADKEEVDSELNRIKDRLDRIEGQLHL